MLLPIPQFQYIILARSLQYRLIEPFLLVFEFLPSNFRKAINTVKIGLIVEASVTGLFFIYCLAKIPSKFKNVAETGCCGWLILPLPLLGSIAGAICWGLFYNFNPYRGEDGASWGPCFWIAMAGWICGVLAWVPRLIYRVR